VKYLDNSDVLELIEQRPHGIISSLDDELKLPNPNDQRYMKSITAISKNSKKFNKDLKNPMDFSIKHFCKEVKYSVEGFIMKNMDNVSGNMKKVF
jgi:myosin V